MSEEQYFETIKSIKQSAGCKGKKLNFIENVTVECNGLPGSGRRCSINIKCDTNKNLVIKNIRFNHQDIIKNIEINASGSVINKLWNEVNGSFDVIRHILNIDDNTILPFGCTSNDNYLPLLKNSPTQLYVAFKIFDEHPDIDYQFTYELYEIDNEPSDLDLLECTFSDIQFTGLEPCGAQYAKIRLDYSNIVSHIIFSIPNKPTHILKKVNITFRVGSKTIILEPIMEKFGNFYIIPLTKSLQPEDMAQYGVDFNKNSYCAIDIALQNHVDQFVEENGVMYALTAPEDSYYIFALSQQKYEICMDKKIRLCCAH